MIVQLEACTAKLPVGNTGLTKAMAEMDTALATATKLRNDERKGNGEAFTDSLEAQTAVARP